MSIAGQKLRSVSCRISVAREAFERFAGSIFGGTLWLLIVAGLAKDRTSFLAILGWDVFVLLGATMFSRRYPERYWSVALLTVCALMAMTLAAVNLRWTVWMHAYRQSTAYDPRWDVSLTTINLAVLIAFVALFALFAVRAIRREAKHRNHAPGGRG